MFEIIKKKMEDIQKVAKIRKKSEIEIKKLKNGTKNWGNKKKWPDKIVKKWRKSEKT